ncbi:TD and POZ domain-containing protein 1-like [Parasteatoda tepidariorum]|uniref:TD and POZ domain-containing protein 1-like n=1 Tax=Parasteatoda tepidariorum TaxID=114398 RepID=UPI00077FCDF6|nr:TD and POZ domain-containing protein 1-like [Parasteatoda tepidariorum]
MSKCKKVCHIRTQIPISTYTFKWSIEHFSKLLLEKEIISPDFYPCCSEVRWYSYMRKSSSHLIWIMCNPTKQKVSVEHTISIVDSSGKVWYKKILHQTYEKYEQCALIDQYDKINTNDIYNLTKDIVTFSCSMTFSGHNIETQTFELISEGADDSKNLVKLSSDLKTMYGVSLYTDVCLRIGADSLRVHKAIICGRSPVFAKMFEHKLEEKETNVIEIVDLKMQVLKDLISFLYTAFVPNEDFHSVLALYYAADKYDVSDLRKFCGEILLSKLTIDNACLALALAERHSDQTLKDSVMTFMDINLEPILVTDEWTNLISEDTKLAAEVMRTRSQNKIDVETNVNEIDQ